MVKKAIIIQLVVLGFLTMTVLKPDFFELRLKESQSELDFWKLAKKVASDTTFFNRIDISGGRFIMIDWESISDDAFPLFNEIVKNREQLKDYRIIAVSPFREGKADSTRLIPYSGMITFKFNENELDQLLRQLIFVTIKEKKERIAKIKEKSHEVSVDYPVVIILEKNKIVTARKKVFELGMIL